MKYLKYCMLVYAVIMLSSCTQEQQNKISKGIQNWTGVNGTLEVYAGNKLVRKFISIDKLSTATATQSEDQRPYRFGYGINDLNFNGIEDTGETKVYFEFSDYSTSYIFYSGE